MKPVQKPARHPVVARLTPLEEEHASLTGCIKWVMLGGFVLGVGVALIAGWIGSDYHKYLAATEPGLTSEITLMIEPGMNFSQISDRLEQEHVISKPLYFQLLVRSHHLATKIQAGEYTFVPEMTPIDVLETIATGDVTHRTLRVPEGFNLKKIARRLEAVEHKSIWSADRFMAIATSKEKARAVGSPVPSLEGYLFPDTYQLTITMTEEDVIDAMIARGRLEQTADRLKQADALGLTWHQVLTLAAIVQSEAAKTDEMPIIAGVFHARLKIGMLLQSDPTAVYDLPDFVGPITRKHLERDSHYNTYMYKGLPPGPICCPGAAAIDATLNPQTHDYLYFVANGEGRHLFAKSQAEHNSNINTVRRKQKAAP